MCIEEICFILAPWSFEEPETHLVLVWGVQPPGEKLLCLLCFTASATRVYFCSSSCFCCASCILAWDWKWSKMKSMVITTSSNLECNYTVTTVTLSGRWLRSKSIKLCSEWNQTDWLIYVCQVKGKQTDTKKPQSVRAERVRGGKSQLYGWRVAPWWGKESIESDRDKWSVRDREKEIQTYACWPQPFFLN